MLQYTSLSGAIDYLTSHLIIQVGAHPFMAPAASSPESSTKITIQDAALESAAKGEKL